MTALELNKDLVRRFIDTYESHDLDALWSLYAPDCYFAALERFNIEPTWDNYKAFMATFLAAFPDVHHHIEHIIADSDKVWALYNVTGTHQGPIRGMAPTGRQGRYSIVGMYRITNGLISEADFVADNLQMMRQLGAND